MSYRDRTRTATSNLPICAKRHMKRILLDLSKTTNLGGYNETERKIALHSAYDVPNNRRVFRGVYGFNKDQRTFLPKAIVNVDDVPFVFTEKTQFFASTHGIITSTGRNYRSFKPGNPVRIWATLDRRGTALHLSCEIENDGRRYSFGFAYAGAGKLEQRLGRVAHPVSEIDGAIYSPDFLLASRLVQQAARPQAEYLRLVGQGVLTEEHVKRINQRFDTISADDLNAFRIIRREWPGDNAVSTAQVKAAADEMKKLHDKFEAWAEEEEGEDRHDWFDNYAKIFLNKPDQHPTGIVAYDYTYTWMYRDQPYCEFSRGKGRTANCTSFLTAIFPDIVKCSLSQLVENPQWCSASAVSECSRSGRPTGR